MKCPNCSAEYSEGARQCEFCGQALTSDFKADPPPIPISMTGEPPALPPGFESGNPYAASDTSTYGSPQIPGHDLPNHLALSITAAVLSFLCCCIPFGIVPIIFSMQVKSKWANGDFEGAKTASSNAKLWAWISIGIALAVFAMNMIFQFALGFNKLD